MKSAPPRVFGKLGFSEIFYLIMILILIVSTLTFLVTGMGQPPAVEIEVYCVNNEVRIKVVSGNIPANDWQYIIFDEKQNPPIVWNKAPDDLRPGADIVIAKNLPPATYRILIMHKPTHRIIYEGKVTVS